MIPQDEFDKILQGMNRGVSYIFCTKVYDKSWNDEFSRKENNKIMGKIVDMLKDVDLTKASREQLKTLGCSSWDEGNDLLLVPLHIALALPKGTKVKDINGVWDDHDPNDFDNDIRFGCCAFGLEVQ